MSRAFVKEDGAETPRRYSLPPRDAPGFPAAAAGALLDGANVGDSAGAEEATGYRWGDPRLVGQVERVLKQAVAEGNDRLQVLAERFLAAARAVDVR